MSINFKEMRLTEKELNMFDVFCDVGVVPEDYILNELSISKYKLDKFRKEKILLRECVRFNRDYITVYRLSKNAKKRFVGNAYHSYSAWSDVRLMTVYKELNKYERAEWYNRTVLLCFDYEDVIEEVKVKYPDLYKELSVFGFSCCNAMFKNDDGEIVFVATKTGETHDDVRKENHAKAYQALHPDEKVRFLLIRNRGSKTVKEFWW